MKIVVNEGEKSPQKLGEKTMTHQNVFWSRIMLGNLVDSKTIYRHCKYVYEILFINAI